MPTISLCMIVKDEEMHIARCLESVADLVDEIIVVDTGSSDRTVEIASQYTTNIYFYPWREDFSEARNYSFSKASMEFCMWMDADDILEESGSLLFHILGKDGLEIVPSTVGLAQFMK